MSFWDVLYDILRTSLWTAIPLMVVALAGMFSERSGVVNIALEGIMAVGAFVSITFIFLVKNSWTVNNWVFLLAIIIAAAAGLVFSILHAYAAINIKSNQIISGTALNMFAPAIAVFLARAAISGNQHINFPNNNFFIRKIPTLSDIPFIGPIFFTRTFITVYIGFLILIVAYIVMFKTRFGLRLRSCGEHPQASDAAGINVKKMRYAGVLISGALAGIGGLFLFVPIGNTLDTSLGASGYGFLALAVLISGQWKPGKILLYSLVFGFFVKIANKTALIPFLDNLNIPTDFIAMTPYIITIIVLIFTSKNSQAPRASGEPYDPGKR